MKNFLVTIFMLISSISVLQAQQFNPVLDKIKLQQEKFPLEKLYLSLDKPYYSVGDTLWFKSFLLNGDLTANNRTDKIYIELFNDSLMLIDHKVIALNNGLGYGDFALSNTLIEGTYTIRAYSNWQQNFGSDYFFQKSFYIGNAGEKTWLLDAYQKLNTAGKKTLDLKVRITNLKNEAFGLKDVEIVLMTEKKKLMKADLQTNLNGIIDTQIPLGENKIGGNYSLVITDKKDKTRQSVLPITLLDINQVDLQFMPEGGYMVNDIFGKVAFKSIGTDGLGKELVGKIINNKNELITDFTTKHNGMGSFYLIPKIGETYTAFYNLNGKEQKTPLPLAKEEGTTLRVDHISNPDSIYVYLKAVATKKLPNYQLVALSASELMFAASINLSAGFANLKLAKKDFPNGIVHFTLFSPQQLPLNERQVFINNKQQISIQITPHQNNYAPKDSVSLNIQATNENGLPLSGSFAIAVTDDAQVKHQTHETIASYFLLQSDLKGYVEDAAWYFNNEEEKTKIALDHLLLTQGWIGYKWDEIILKNTTASFKPEKGNTVSGKVTGLFKPREGIIVNMLSFGKQMIIVDTVTDATGNFLFKDLPLIDSTAYTIKIKNEKGKTASGNIFVEDFNRSIIPLDFKNIKPWYVNSDSTTLNYFKTTGQKQKQEEKILMGIKGETLLNEVVINGQRKLKEFISKTAWDANLYKEISNEELKLYPQKKLIDLLKEKLDGFGISAMWTNSCSGRISRHNFVNFVVGGRLISHIMIDKINTHIAASGIDDQYNASTEGVSNTALSPDVYETNRYILNTLTAAEITNIAVYKGCSYFFLEITTRSGKGPFTTPSAGVYIYRPLPIYLAKEFYSPKYNANNTNKTPDYRSTIFWDANVITDENGKAKISFYSADKPSTYTVKVEGTDLMGRFGYKTSSLMVENKKDSK
jgi:hypothetical protein